MKNTCTADPETTIINVQNRDALYAVAMQIGSKGNEFSLVIDTGSSLTWVVSSGCESPGCTTRPGLGPNNSDTLSVTNTNFDIGYRISTASGKIAKDYLTLSGLTFKMAFGLATEVPFRVTQNSLDGILGLAWAGNNGSAYGGYKIPTFMDVLYENGLIMNKLVGLHIPRARNRRDEGQLTIGWINPERWSGPRPLQVLPNANNTTNLHWRVIMDDIQVNGKPLGLKNRVLVLDTGAPVILIPLADQRTLHSAILGAKHNNDGSYHIPCATDANLTVVFQGTGYSISPKDYVGRFVGTPTVPLCESQIFGYPSGAGLGGQWVMGDVFLKSVYTVLDWGNNQISFGQNLRQ